MMKILMVCLGNICRSPLAEGVMKDMIRKNNLPWIVESVGTGNYNIGDACHKLSQKVARMHGIDLSRHRARQFRKEDMLNFDRIYVMDSDNYNDVKRMSRELWDPSKTNLLMNEAHPGENKAIPDPWYSEEPSYHKVYNMIDEACGSIIKKYAGKENTALLKNNQ